MRLKEAVLKLDMSTITALFLLLTQSESLVSKYKVINDPTWCHLNWEEASKWQSCISVDSQYSFDSVCRKACFEFIIKDVTLSGLAAIGRGALIATLSEDEIQVFRNSNLLNEIPTEEITSWWDSFKSLNRQRIDETKTKQGRLAEYWTMLQEREYTAKYCSMSKPVWISLEGDHFGYDIKSYRSNKDNYDNVILIEVKSFSRLKNPVIYITKTEWNKALKSTPNYIFVIWCMENIQHKTLTMKDIISHVPKNIGSGEWETVTINVKSLWPELETNTIEY